MPLDRLSIITRLIAERRVVSRKPGTTLDHLIDEYISEHRIVQCELGGSHALFINGAGDVYVCGKNARGEIGDVDSTGAIAEPELASFTIPSGVKQAIAGVGYSFFVSNKGDVYVCGSGAKAVLGESFEGLAHGVVKLSIAQGHCIHSIAVGKKHLLLLTDKGEVFRYTADSAEGLKLMVVDVGKRIQAIATGLTHSVLLSVDGEVYAGVITPQRLWLGGDVKCKAICAAGMQTQMITVDGDVFVHGASASHAWESSIASIKCKQQVSVAPSGHFVIKNAVRYVAMPAITTMSSGKDNALYVGDDGQLFVAGKHVRGEQLLFDIGSAAKVDTGREKVIQVSMFDGFCAMVLTEGGAVRMSQGAAKRLGVYLHGQSADWISMGRAFMASAFEDTYTGARSCRVG